MRPAERYSVDEHSKQQRGSAIRAVILEALEDSYAHDGVWPPRLPGSLALSYQRPSVELISAHPEFATATVVAHESFEQFPHGIWVAYADGHMEFVLDPAALAECQLQGQILQETLTSRGTLEGKDERFDGKVTGSLRLRILDPDGQPLEGAILGVFGSFGDRRSDVPHTRFVTAADTEPVVSNANGEAAVPAEFVFNSEHRFGESVVVPLYVLHEARGLAALETMNKAEFADQAEIRVVRMKPACTITGSVESIGLSELGKQIRLTSAHVFPPGQFTLRALHSAFNGPSIRFIVPPGDYGIWANANGLTNGATRYVRIGPNQRELRLQLELEPVATLMMFGHPAPEFRSIKAWKNGGPVELAGLRGKVVLLDFWGTWCGPCMDCMPELTKLHDEYKDKGLVIIAIHDDSEASMEEVDHKLESAVQGWGGRDLPFRLALDGGGETRMIHTADRVRGATTALYGVRRWPTTLLIDRDGILVREVNVRSGEARAEVERLLGKSGQP